MSIRRNSRLGVVTRDQSMAGVWTLWISIRDHPLWERYFCYDCRYIPNSSWAEMYGTLWNMGKNIQKNYLAQLMPDFGHQQVLTVKLRNFSVLPLENELGNMNMEPGKGGKSYWKSSFCTPRNHVWCPPARATTRVVSCAIWLISSAEETWSTWRFFGLRSMAFEAPWRSSSTRISMTTAMYWQTKSSEAVLGLCSLFLDVLDVSWNEWEYLPFWCQLEQDLVHQQHQYSDRWLFVSATSLCWIFTNKLTSQKDCEKRLEFI